MNIEPIINAGGFLLTIVGTYLATSGHFRKLRDEDKKRFAESQVKEYAAQRDFNHLERNLRNLQTGLDQLMEGQKQIMKELELRVDKLEMRQVKFETTTRAVFARATGESFSDILNRDPS